MEVPLTCSKSNDDCYFYYYSSCNKGSFCPFRHEPSSLRNETMCKYWLQGICTKPNCIFRHMEINAPRDKIPCFFEGQPGGCKKVHCSFFHSDILNQPREEDVAKKPDLILPVRSSEEDTSKDENVSHPPKIRASILLQREDDCQSLFNPEETSPSLPSSLVIPMRTIIVPIHDGESDTESAIVSPQKMGEPQLSVHYEWELQRLKQIQAEEGNLLGYSFENDFDDDDSCYTSSSSIEESEEFIEESYQVIDVEDAVHRRLSEYNVEKESSFDPKEADLKNLIKSAKHRSNCLASRVLNDTLQNNFKKGAIHTRIPTVCSNTDIQSKLASKDTFSPKKSAKERLGMFDHVLSNTDFESAPLNCNPVKLKLARKYSAIDDLSDFDFKIKSLDEIKKEKVREGKVELCRPPSNSFIIESKISKIDKTSKCGQTRFPEESLGIKTLAELKADRHKHHNPIKRPTSPVTQNNSSLKRTKL